VSGATRCILCLNWKRWCRKMQLAFKSPPPAHKPQICSSLRNNNSHLLSTMKLLSLPLRFVRYFLRTVCHTQSCWDRTALSMWRVWKACLSVLELTCFRHRTQSKWVMVYEGVPKSFRTGRLEQELQIVQLPVTKRSCIAILWVSLVSFAATTLCVASQRVFIIVVYFVIDSVRKLLDTPSKVHTHSNLRNFHHFNGKLYHNGSWFIVLKYCLILN
jgi:hypothetical protein